MMMKCLRLTTILLSFLSFLLPMPLFAESLVPYKPPLSGLKVQWKNTAVTEILETKSNITKRLYFTQSKKYKYKTESGYYKYFQVVKSRTTNLTKNIMRPARVYSFEPSKIDALWPLKVGNETSYIVKSHAIGNWPLMEKVQLHVVRQESITLPIGTFSAFVVEKRREIIKTNRVGQQKSRLVISRHWFVPEISFALKIEVEGSKRKNKGQKQGQEVGQKQGQEAGQPQGQKRGQNRGKKRAKQRVTRTAADITFTQALPRHP